LLSATDIAERAIGLKRRGPQVPRRFFNGGHVQGISAFRKGGMRLPS
jgi:hypothetical protein